MVHALKFYMQRASWKCIFYLGTEAENDTVVVHCHGILSEKASVSDVLQVRILQLNFISGRS